MIPVYNESDCIKKVASEWEVALRFQKIVFEIIFINDGSTDNTKDVLLEITSKSSCLKMIDQINGGHGNALLTGYHYAINSRSEYVFQVDSDDQFLASDFSKLWKMREASPFLLGIRTKRDDPWFRLVITKILRKSISILCGTKIKDANIPFRLIQRRFLKAMIHCLPSGAFAPNIFLSILASRYIGTLPQVPVGHIERQTGQVSIIRFGLLKACTKSFFDLLKFSSVLNFKTSRMKLELEQPESETFKHYA